MILHCLTCKALVDAKQIAEDTRETTDMDFPEATYDGTLLRTYIQYTFLKCPKCFNPFLTKRVYSNDDSCLYDIFLTLYPISPKAINSEINIYIKKAFEEALLCFDTSAYTACVILCRKTIEGICKEYNIEKGNLSKKLIELKNQGVIDDNLYDWADALRIAGNDAAHDLDVTFSRKDAQDIIDFTYAIIDYIFTYRKKFQLFKKRKDKK